MTQTVPMQDILAGLFFLVMVVVTVAGAIFAVACRRMIRAVAGLACCFIGLAGLFYYLQGPFVALMEILIYVGAVSVVIVFAVMLAEPEGAKKRSRISGFGAMAGLLASGLLFYGLSALALKTNWVAAKNGTAGGSMEEIGVQLLSTHSMAFELISLVLLLAILGALVLARRGRERDPGGV